MQLDLRRKQLSLKQGSMMSSFWLLLVAIVHCLVFPTAVNAELAFVRPNTSVSCAGSQQPCLTFNEYAQQVDQYFVDNTTFLFLPGTHELDVQLDLEGLSNMTFAPSDEGTNDTAQILLSPSVNITWTNCENVVVNGFVFIVNGQFDFGIVFSPELTFQNASGFLANLTLIGNGTRLFAMCRSSDLQISNLVVKGVRAPTLHASNSAIVFRGQNIFFSNSINISVVEYSFAQAGGSLIQLHDRATCHIHGNTSFIQNKIYYAISGSMPLYVVGGGTAISVTHGSTLVISGIASFVRNQANASTGPHVSMPFRVIGSTPDININGGAIYASYLSRVIFEETSNISFIENSATSDGGAMYIDNSNLTIRGRVLFEGNSASDDGGAIAIDEGVILAMNNHSIVFRNNTSPSNGGAISSVGTSVELRYVLFERNTALYGGAICAQDIFNTSSVELRDVLFERNSASYGGAVCAQDMDSTNSIELRDTLFQRNTAMLNGGAVYICASVINMTGTLHFVQNFAQRGGAIAFEPFLTAIGSLLLIEPLMANFVENSATMGGGVLFFNDFNFIRQICDADIIDTELLHPQTCFIELSSNINTISLNFDNNTAEIAGRIFYGGNLDRCFLPVNDEMLENPLSIIASISNVNVNVSNYKENATSYVSSDPLRVCFCKSDSLECDNMVEIETVRGREFILQAVIVGQGMGAIPSDVRVSLDNDAQLGSPAQRIQPTGKTCTNITYRLFAVSKTITITLFPNDSPCKDNYAVLTHITFLPCPNGFVQNGPECVCEERLQRFNAICNVDNSSIQWTTSVFWVGVLYDDNSTYQGLILHSGCPFDYCVDTPIPITLDNLDIQCNHNHSGTLCGSCKEGNSIVLGTLHCLPCSSDYLALIFAFALAGVALVAILLLLRLTVTAGTINGLIFYANIVQANSSFFFPAGVTNILTVFVAWLNLDLGIETCFYNGMTTYAYMWLQFVFPFYIWFLIGLIIVATRYSSKLTKIFGRNPVAALATLFLLSYSKLLRTLIGTLSVAMLEYPDDNYKIVWFFDGNVAYESAEHVILITFATLVLVFLFIPYTLLVFFAHWLQALSHWRILSWLNKIKPFMDTYHAPYKKQTRYWTGLFLFVRLFLFIFAAINRNLIPVVVTSVTVILASLAWVHMGIYENRFNNILEAFFIANLCIFAAATYYDQTNKLSRARTAYFFVGLAFSVCICIVIVHVFQLLRETALWKKIPEPDAKKYFKSKKDKNKDFPPGDDHEQSFILRAPTQTTVDLREPLLEQ